MGEFEITREGGEREDGRGTVSVVGQLVCCVCVCVRGQKVLPSMRADDAGPSRQRFPQKIYIGVWAWGLSTEHSRRS